ncbi:MAG TPA: glycosyltransferase, partial [Leptospiraceae bacterium]|nr:glycosyltransferase [Leptospiraceae bacterium]
MTQLSIITINLNNKEGLQKTIDSVLNQTFRNFEFIVIDGGSVD